MAARMMDTAITTQRLDELMRWHGTDESNLPPPHTLEYLSRDTVAALAELQQVRERLLALRAAMGQAFWARDPHELRAIVLDALGPPPAAPVATGGAANDSGAAANGTGAKGNGANGTANGAPAHLEDAAVSTHSARAHGRRTRTG